MRGAQGLIGCFAEDGHTFAFSVPEVPVIRDVAIRFFWFDRSTFAHSVKRRNLDLSKVSRAVSRCAWGCRGCGAKPPEQGIRVHLSGPPSHLR